MSRFFVGLALWALLLALAACGGDSEIADPARDTELADDSLTESIQNKDSDSAKDAEPGEKVDAVVPTFDDLPACTGDRNGKTAYVEDEDSAYVCKKGLWVVDDSLSKAVRPDSENKSSSSAKAKSSSNETSESSSSAKSSSSKDGKSSSSDEKNSSSCSSVSSNSSSSSVVPTNSSSSSGASTVSVASPCKTETEDNCEYGTLTDDRDGQTYKIVKIGEQWWMAENLNYAYTGVPFKYVLSTDSNLVYYSDSTSWCYDNDAANCAKYGRLYTWAAAMDSVGTWSTNSKGCGYGTACSPTYPVRGICPEGWHLPDITEWYALFSAVGGEATAGIMLKSTEGWISNGNGSDAYSFSALPAGDRYNNGGYYYEGGYTYFWSSTEDGSNDAYLMRLDYNGGNARLYDNNKKYGFSVRCVKD